MNFHRNHGDGDDGSASDHSGSLCDSDAQSVPEGMTEEEAMEIWLRRSRDIEERLQRERQLQREFSQQGQEMELDQRALELEEAQPRVDSRLGDDGEHCHRQSLPFAASAAHETGSPAGYAHSSEWNEALRENAMGPYDPAHHDAWVAHQRFMNFNRPGLVDAYVPSTPGMARLLELAREEDMMFEAADRGQWEALAEAQRREQEAFDALRVVERQQAAFLAIEAQWRIIAPSLQEQRALENHSRTRYNTAGSGNVLSFQESSAMAAEAREFGLLSQARHTNINSAQPRLDNTNSHNSHPPSIITTTNRSNYNYSSSHDPHPPVQPTTTQSNDNFSRSSDRTSDSRSGASKKSKEVGQKTNAVYLATPSTTEYNTKPVGCYICRANLYTHPLAQNYICQACGQISTVPVAEEKDAGTAWEEKMMDRCDHGHEDYEDTEMYY